VPQAALADLAALEWAQTELFDAADDDKPPLGAADLAVLGVEHWVEEWADVAIEFKSTVRLVVCDFEVAPVIAAIAEGKVPPKPLPGRHFYLVYRSGEDCYHRLFSESEALLFRALQRGLILYDATSEVAEALLVDFGGVIQAAVTALGDWLDRGIVNTISQTT
jgi:hypothetical protein